MKKNMGSAAACLLAFVMAFSMAFAPAATQPAEAKSTPYFTCKSKTAKVGKSSCVNFICSTPGKAWSTDTKVLKVYQPEFAGGNRSQIDIYGKKKGTAYLKVKDASTGRVYSLKVTVMK